MYQDPTLTREETPMAGYGGASPVPVPLREEVFSWRNKASDGWQLVGEEFSMWSDPPIEPKWIRQIQVFEPNLVPLWVRLTFKGPNSQTETFTRMGLGRVFDAGDNHINHDEELKNLVMPGIALPWKIPGKPHIVASVFRDPSEPDVIEGVPVKPFVGFSQNVVDELRWQYENYRSAEHAEADAVKMAGDRAEADQRKLDKLNEEAEYRFKNDKGERFYELVRDMPGSEADAAVVRTGGK